MKREWPHAGQQELQDYLDLSTARWTGICTTSLDHLAGWARENEDCVAALEWIAANGPGWTWVPPQNGGGGGRWEIRVAAPAGYYAYIPPAEIQQMADYWLRKPRQVAVHCDL